MFLQVVLKGFSQAAKPTACTKCQYKSAFVQVVLCTGGDLWAACENPIFIGGSLSEPPMKMPIFTGGS